jgi:CTP:molybdopterin cytidylyltransferase MocA
MPGRGHADVVGVLLAAGAGRRMGGPKALLRNPSDARPLLRGAVDALVDGGCDAVVVVLGAAAEEARALVPQAAIVVVAENWDQGMGASLRAGLGAVADTEARAAMVSLVDLPDVGPDVVARVLAAAGGDLPQALARAAYGGVPGHPVLLGRDHWDGVTAAAQGDRGARGYLAMAEPLLVECGDLATGADVDTPEQL